MFNLQYVEKLELQENRLTSIPPALLNLKNLSNNLFIDETIEP